MITIWLLAPLVVGVILVIWGGFRQWRSALIPGADRLEMSDISRRRDQRQVFASARKKRPVVR